MTLTVHTDLIQGSDEWLDARRGIVTASTVGQLITPKTVKPSNNDTSRNLTASLVAERITGHTEHVYPSRAMERGTMDEPIARDYYTEHHLPATEVGFMTRVLNNGHTLGYSPDGLVEEIGLIEIKSRAPKVHLKTILADEVPLENMAQIQAGLLVTGRNWCDYISFCSGMPLYIKRVFPDDQWFEAINLAVEQFEANAAIMTDAYTAATNGLIPTERIDHFEEEMMI